MTQTLATPLERAQMQGFLLRGYSKHHHAAYLVLHVKDAAPARRWIGRLLDEKLVPDAEQHEPAVPIHLAFTYAGLQALGMPADALKTFASEFQDGMIGETSHRARVLGDVGDAAPDRWDWGSPQGPPVHVLASIFAKTPAALEGAIARERGLLAASGLGETRLLLATPSRDDRKEHFGFQDGFGQPVIAGTRRAEDEPADNVIAPGEFILGYANEYDRLPDSPLVPAAEDPKGVLDPAPGDAARRDFGRNGSYLVFRQLHQDVARFWDDVAARTRPAPTVIDPPAAIRLASKMVGRWPSGAPLVLHPDHDVGHLDEANAFGYAKEDATGDRCPIGSHVRRSNPRDALVEDDPKTSLDVARKHRILRRGRPYGAPLVDSMDPSQMIAVADDGKDRGMHFICLNASLARQFEFVQHTWINNPKFGGLYNDPDPLVSNHKNDIDFTEQACPVRHEHRNLQRYVLMRGGAYFFMPGMKALRYLASR